MVSLTVQSLAYPTASKTMVFDDLTGLGVNREGGRGEADRYCTLLPPTALHVWIRKSRYILIRDNLFSSHTDWELGQLKLQA